jgi:methionyl-tRNA formyltransferase
MGSVVVLASRSATSYLLINQLAARFAVDAVVFEGVDRRKLLRHRLRKLGWWTAAGQMVFTGYDRLVIRRRARPKIAKLLACHDVSPPDGRLEVIDVESVNGEEVRTLIGRKRPRVVVVSGTGIIGRKVLELGPVFMNIHVGITPRFRGVHGGFWAIHEGTPELVGTTIHIVDPGVDTGAILAQVPVEIDPLEDGYRTIPVKQYLGAMDALTDAVNAALDGSLTPFARDDLESRQWYSPTPRQYMRFLQRMRMLRTRKDLFASAK